MPPIRTSLTIAVSILGFAVALPADAQAAQRPNAQEAINRIFQADTNGDGVVTRAELLAYRAQQWQRMDRNSDGYFSRDDLPGFLQSKWDGGQISGLRQNFDTNHDGRISYDEFVKGPTVGFDIADANRDNVVTRAEANAAASKVEKRL